MLVEFAFSIFRVRPSMVYNQTDSKTRTDPFFSRALFMASSVVKVTKPKPRGFPVSRL